MDDNPVLGIFDRGMDPLGIISDDIIFRGAGDTIMMLK
eukprot:CAMPEP_0170966264 /NCGR_PEP_ID=MMETSP0735-20130129/41559_1 /TAXON_ID=186038 /ORGANISM="Fragilariopsis kerguelensis, Strain L26-C5" /LENGTH=37 /DNA_ID= /DNA_START= /DNA_END= /DNA_ORIENTATION=